MSACDRILSRRHAFLDGELPPSEAAEVRAHLEACAGCRSAFEDERAFLGLVTAGGRETAPPELRRRVEAILGSAERSSVSDRVGRRAWGLLAAAAVAGLFLVARPWGGGDPPAAMASASVAFAADHRAHAESAPSEAPFPPGAEIAPPLPGGEIRGISRCVIEGHTYAHFTYRGEGHTFSVYLPLDHGSLPVSGATEATVSGGAPTTVVAVDAAGGRPAAVLVSEALAAPALLHVWQRG